MVTFGPPLGQDHLHRQTRERHFGDPNIIQRVSAYSRIILLPDQESSRSGCQAITLRTVRPKSVFESPGFEIVRLSVWFFRSKSCDPKVAHCWSIRVRFCFYSRHPLASRSQTLKGETTCRAKRNYDSKSPTRSSTPCRAAACHRGERRGVTTPIRRDCTPASALVIPIGESISFSCKSPPCDVASSRSGGQLLTRSPTTAPAFARGRRQPKSSYGGRSSERGRTKWEKRWRTLSS